MNELLRAKEKNVPDYISRVRLLSTRQVAELLNVTPQAVYYMSSEKDRLWQKTGEIERRQLPREERLHFVRVGRCRRFRLTDVEEYIRRTNGGKKFEFVLDDEKKAT
jgi:hypothetical protein